MILQLEMEFAGKGGRPGLGCRAGVRLRLRAMLVTASTVVIGCSRSPSVCS